MRRILLVAEGTLDHPLRNVLSIVVGMTITLICGLIILRSGMPGPLVIVALIALLVGVAWIKARFGGQREFRVEKPADDEPLRVTGRFEEGHVGLRQPCELLGTELDNDQLWFEVADDAESRRFHLRPPAFATDSLKRLHEAIGELATLPGEEVRSRYRAGDREIKLYDAKKVILLRFHQKPGYTMIIWLVAGITVVLWLVVGPVLLG